MPWVDAVTIGRTCIEDDTTVELNEGGSFALFLWAITLLSRPDKQKTIKSNLHLGIEEETYINHIQCEK